MKAAKVLPLFFVLGLIARAATAADDSKPWLKGVDTVKVNITMSKALVDAGVPGARLRQQVELQLRKAGMKVDQTSDGATLNIDVTGCQGGTNVYACSVQITMNDTVTVSRNNACITTPIWGPDLYILYLPNELSSTLLETTSARLDFFLNDWLRENPR